MHEHNANRTGVASLPLSARLRLISASCNKDSANRGQRLVYRARPGGGLSSLLEAKIGIIRQNEASLF